MKLTVRSCKANRYIYHIVSPLSRGCHFIRQSADFPDNPAFRNDPENRVVVIYLHVTDRIVAVNKRRAEIGGAGRLLSDREPVIGQIVGMQIKFQQVQIIAAKPKRHAVLHLDNLNGAVLIFVRLIGVFVIVRRLRFKG